MIRVILTEAEPGSAHALKSLLSVTDDIGVVGLPQDGLEAAQMAIQARPDVLIVQEKIPAMDGYEVCQLVNMAAPEVGCILIVDEHRPSVVKEAMRAGANAVIFPDDNSDKLLETIEMCSGARDIMQSKAYATVTDPSKMPVTIGLISAKDGVGKTTLATNLSVLFASRFPASVVLADMYAQLGDIRLLLNISATGSLVDLAPYAEELDIELINTHLSTHESSLRILPGSINPEPVPLDTLSVPYLATLLGILRRNYRFTFCDLPSTLWSGSLYVLSRCQVVLLVTNLFELTTIRDTTSLLQIITNGDYISKDAVKLVVNRTSSQDRFSVTDLEEAAGMKVDFTLPNDTDTVITATNRGEPFILNKPRAPISQAIAKLADQVLETVGQPNKQNAA